MKTKLGFYIKDISLILIYFLIGISTGFISIVFAMGLVYFAAFPLKNRYAYSYSIGACIGAILFILVLAYCAGSFALM